MVSERIGLIDLDDSALGPPELDIGNLCGHIELLQVRAGNDLRRMTERLLGVYGRTGPPLDASLLERCQRLTLLRLTCIHRNISVLERLPDRASL